MVMMISPVPVPLFETMVKSMAKVVPTGPRAGKTVKVLNLASPLSLTIREERLGKIDELNQKKTHLGTVCPSHSSRLDRDLPFRWL